MTSTKEYMKKRQDFVRQFSEQKPTLCDDIPVNITDQQSYILCNPVHSSTQRAPRYSCHEVDASRMKYKNTGMNHTEDSVTKNGIVKGLNSKQKTNCNFRKDDGCSKHLISAAEMMEKAIRQNSAIDMYHSYFEETPPQKNVAFKRQYGFN